MNTRGRSQSSSYSRYDDRESYAPRGNMYDDYEDEAPRSSHHRPYASPVQDVRGRHSTDDYDSHNRSRNARPTDMQRNQNDRNYTPDGMCKHKMITKQLIVATLLTEYKDLETCPYRDVTIKYHCNVCRRDVFFNTMSLGVCYSTGLLFVDFKKSKPRFERSKVLDYTSKRIPKDVLDSCLKSIRGDRTAEPENEETGKE